MNIDYTGVERPMTKADKSLWVEALRSEEYGQGTGQLFNTTFNKYCCLGVAADVCNMTSSSKSTLRTNNKAGSGYTALFLPEGVQGDLWRLNDNHGVKFPEIADFIETNIKAVDE